MPDPSPEPDRLIADAVWLRRLAGQLGADPSQAEDVQQEVALATLLRPDRRDRPWLATLARNLTITQWRRRKADERRVAALPSAAPAVSAADLAAEAELQQLAVAAVLELPEAYRDTILRRFMEGLSVAETAQVMAVPVATVRTRQKRALAMLRARLLPQAQRRGFAAVVGTLVAWSGAMSSKKMVVVGAGVLFALMWFQPWVSSTDEISGVTTGSGAEPASSVVAAAGSPSQAQQRVEAGRSPVATATASKSATLTVRAIYRQSQLPAPDVPMVCRQHDKADVGITARTDANGVVSFENLPPGRHGLRSLLGSVSAELAAGEHQTVELSLRDGKPEIGIVVDRAGAPVAGAEILVCARGVVPQRTFVLGRSGDDGRFAVQGVPIYAALGARHATLGTSDFRLLLGSPSQGTTVRLPGVARRVTGHVVDARGKPVSGAWVQIGHSQPPVRRDAMASDVVVMQRPAASLIQSGADGSFAVEGLQAAELQLLVYRDGFAAHREMLQLGDGDARVRVVMGQGGTLIGTVRGDDGRPFAGVEVRRVEIVYPERSSTWTDADGTFRFEGLPAGELEFAIDRDGRESTHRTFRLVDGETRRVAIELIDGVKMRGRLVDLTGRALVGWQVSLDGGVQKITDDEGTFAFHRGGSEHSLALRDPDSKHEVWIPQTIAGSELHTIVVATSASGGTRLRGRLLDPDGVPLSAGELTVRQGDAPELEMRTSPAADGTFSIGPWAAGRADLQFEHADWVFAPKSIAVGAGPEQDLGDLRVIRPASVQVRLLGSGFELSKTRIELVAGEARHRTLDGGEVRTIRGLLPGSYQLVVRVDGEERERQAIELSVGQQQQRDIVIR